MPRASTRTRAAGSRSSSGTGSVQDTPRRSRGQPVEEAREEQPEREGEEKHADEDDGSRHARTNGHHRRSNGNGRAHVADEDSEEEKEAEDDAEVDALVQQAHRSMTSSLLSSSTSSSAPRSVPTEPSNRFAASPATQPSAASPSPSALQPAVTAATFIPPPPRPLFSKHSHLFHLTPTATPTPPVLQPTPPQVSSTARSAAASHFALPTPPLTAELKRDLRLLALRPYLDPKRFYKRSERKPSHFPTHFAMGTVLESAEGWHHRERAAERREWWVEGVREEGGGWLKRKFEEVQEKNKGRECGRAGGGGKKRKGRR